MPFSVQYVGEQDIPRMVDVFWSSFGHIPLLRVTGNIPSPGDPLDREARRQVVINRFTNSVGKLPITHVLKAVDDETGAIAAVAIWNVFKGPEALGKWRENTRTDEKMKIPPGLKVKGFRYCWERIYKKYKMVFGESGRDHYRMSLARVPAHYLLGPLTQSTCRPGSSSHRPCICRTGRGLVTLGLGLSPC